MTNTNKIQILKEDLHCFLRNTQSIYLKEKSIGIPVATILDRYCRKLDSIQLGFATKYGEGYSPRFTATLQDIENDIAKATKKYEEWHFMFTVDLYLILSKDDYDFIKTIIINRWNEVYLSEYYYLEIRRQADVLTLWFYHKENNIINK